MENVWLKIPYQEYESHMQQVGQTRILASVFKHYVQTCRPKNILILGSATGNGLSAVPPATTVTAIDINPSYLHVLKSRHSSLKNLHTVCADVSKIRLEQNSTEFIYISLLLEYIPDYISVLEKTAGALTPGGHLLLIIQLPSPQTTFVSPTAYSTLSLLSCFSSYTDPALIKHYATQSGLRLSQEKDLQAPGHKTFKILFFQKPAVEEND